MIRALRMSHRVLMGQFRVLHVESISPSGFAFRSG